MMLDSIDNGPLVYLTVEEDGHTRPKKYSELTEAQQLQDDCDVQVTNIILHGLTPDVYVLVNHQEAAKDIWDKVKLLMKGTELSYQERDCRLYNLFDKFASIQVETLYEYYWRFSQLINDMHTIRMTMQQVQVDANTEKIQLTALTKQWHSYLLWHQGFHLQTINSERLPILKIRKPFKMEESQFNKFKEDKLRVLLILDEEQLAFLADTGIEEALVAQQTIPHNSAFQTKDLDAYDSDCDDISSAKAVLMANLLICDSDVLFEVPYSDTYLNDMINQEELQYAGIQDTNSFTPNDLLVLSLVEQMADHVANLDEENQTNKMVNESLTAELERYKERVSIFEQRLNVDLNKHKELTDSQMDDLIRNRNAKFAAFQQEIDTLKENLSNQVKEKESLSTTLTVFKTQCKEIESKYMDKETVLENQNKELENTLSIGYQNPFHLKKSQRIKPTLYGGSVIAKDHDVISVIDDEETLILEEEKQAFWLKYSNYNPDTSVKLHTPVRIEAPSELPKVSLENESLKKLKYQLASFDKVVKKRTTCDAIMADTPMVEKSKLDEDPQGKVVDPTRNHEMIGTLMYLTSNDDHAGCQDTRKCTSGTMQLLGDRLEQVENGVVKLYFVRTEYQLVDILTKPLARERLEFLINKLGSMEMKPDIENMTINEYLEYEAAKKRQLWDNVRFRRSLTNYDEADFNSFHQNKSSTFNYSYSLNLPPLHPYSLPVQTYPKNYLVSANISNYVDIESMTIAEYNLYVAKQELEKNLLNNHSYGFTPQFFAQTPHTPNAPVDKKDSEFDKILDDLFRMGVDNLKRMRQDIVQDSIFEQDVDLEEDQEEDGNDEDIFDMWNITVEDIERIRQFLTPNISDIIKDVIQPLIPTTLYTTPPNEDYVAPATKPILDKLLEDTILNVAMVDEDANSTRDLEELDGLTGAFSYH
ncbi:hypothetical protein Tco_1409486 [Tanacetum coccineum]